MVCAKFTNSAVNVAAAASPGPAFPKTCLWMLWKYFIMMEGASAMQLRYVGCTAVAWHPGPMHLCSAGFVASFWRH